ncbi:Fe-S cluster assembly protein SufD [Candidatus Pelagibacter communis]|uniref:Fe-S cluster assembly protein SufD n=1 Tax=Pelagibacter ubique TaxID=198252 RepID=UPI00094C3649|nr:Fe-S cluster assembly protein SufD [Candidatus Pelagibacter ubique]
MQNELKLNFDKIISLNNFSDSQKKIKQENFNNYFEKGLPNKRNEDWKFSDINQIISKNFDNLNFIVDQKKFFEEKDFPLDFEHNKISFVDGKLYDFDFKHEDKDKILVDQNLDLDDTIYQNTLLNLNSAFLTSVSKITIKKGYNVKKPLILFNYLSDGLKSSAINSRVDINLEDESSLCLVNFLNENSEKNFINFRQKIKIGENSILKNYNLDSYTSENIKYFNKDINLSKNSHLEYFILSEGSKFIKQDINCNLDDEYGSIALNGIINLENEKHHEIKTVINHKKENCKSYQLIKSVLNDKSKGIYQGKIFVSPEAQKTDGYQLSRALLLNESVEFNAKPELEIYADDVKCSHGSTSGNIDENSIFYLMSRGLSYSESKKLLTNGFLNEVIEKISNEDVKRLVKKLSGINV